MTLKEHYALSPRHITWWAWKENIRHYLLLLRFDVAHPLSRHYSALCLIIIIYCLRKQKTYFRAFCSDTHFSNEYTLTAICRYATFIIYLLQEECQWRCWLEMPSYAHWASLLRDVGYVNTPPLPLVITLFSGAATLYACRHYFHAMPCRHRPLVVYFAACRSLRAMPLKMRHAECCYLRRHPQARAQDYATMSFCYMVDGLRHRDITLRRHRRHMALLPFMFEAIILPRAAIECSLRAPSAMSGHAATATYTRCRCRHIPLNVITLY